MDHARQRHLLIKLAVNSEENAGIAWRLMVIGCPRQDVDVTGAAENRLLEDGIAAPNVRLFVRGLQHVEYFAPFLEFRAQSLGASQLLLELLPLYVVHFILQVG